MQEPGVKLKRNEDKVRVQATILIPGLQCQPHRTSSQGELQAHLQVMMMVFSPSHDGLSAMILAWVVTSWGDNCGDSLG